MSPFSLIKIRKVKTQAEGIKIAKDFLYENSDSKTALFLSGGRTPKDFYADLAADHKLSVGAVGLVDERYGAKFHENSNEFMIKNSGLTSYLQGQNILFYPILEGKDIKETTKDYDETLRFLFNYFPKSIGILGIGLDGHTAGIPAGISNSKFSISNKTDLVTAVLNFPIEPKKRITMTFNALQKLDLLIILVFGKDKKEALKLMFSEGSLDEIPSRFFQKEEITKKTILITDQIG